MAIPRRMSNSANIALASSRSDSSELVTSVKVSSSSVIISPSALAIRCAASAARSIRDFISINS